MSGTLIAVVAAAALLAGCAGFARGRSAARELNELGSVSLPKRLDARSPLETPAYAVFPFERPANSIRFMGSNTAIAEILAVAAWKDASRQAAREQAVSKVKYMMESRPQGFSTVREPVLLTKQGDYETGEGIQYVNASSAPAWIVVREAPAEKLTVAYMVWKQDGSLQQARDLVDSVVASFQRKSSVDEYLAAAASRPATERDARLKAVEAALAKLGVPSPPLDGGPVEREGVLYELFTHATEGRMFLMHCPLGELDAAAVEGYRFGPDAPTERLQVAWLAPATAGPTVVKGIESASWTTARMQARMSVGQVYAVRATWVDQLDMPGESVVGTLRIAARMRQAHAAGKLLARK